MAGGIGAYGMRVNHDIDRLRRNKAYHSLFDTNPVKMSLRTECPSLELFWESPILSPTPTLALCETHCLVPTSDFHDKGARS